MEYFFIFLTGAIGLAVILYQMDRQQRKSIKKILKANKNVPQLLMQRSADQKLLALKGALVRLDVFSANDGNGMGYMDSYIARVTTEKKTIALQLELLIISYKNGLTGLNDYYTKLGALLIRVNELRPELQEL